VSFRILPPEYYLLDAVDAAAVDASADENDDDDNDDDVDIISSQISAVHTLTLYLFKIKCLSSLLTSELPDSAIRVLVSCCR
jgi:hypothetical protein